MHLVPKHGKCPWGAERPIPGEVEVILGELLHEPHQYIRRLGESELGSHVACYGDRLDSFP